MLDSEVEELAKAAYYEQANDKDYQAAWGRDDVVPWDELEEYKKESWRCEVDPARHLPMPMFMKKEPDGTQGDT